MENYWWQKKVIIVLYASFLCIPAYLYAQVLPDQVWLHGINDFPDQSGYGNAKIIFEENLVSINPTNLGMNFESTMAVMPDSLGNIIFYTNGCYIANALGDTMANGTGINPGEIHDWTCAKSGYISPLGATILQLPENDHLFYLFHMGVKYGVERRLRYGPFYYTIIDMNLDGGKGAVVSKNNILSEENLESFVAVRHGNGQDWWLVFPIYGTNKYHKLLFSKSGIVDLGEQEIGQSLMCQHVGSSTFSPNGIRYARQQQCGVEVMDFDRCSGFFSNDRFLTLPSNSFGGGGVAFNKTGTRLFVSTQLSIQSADLTQSSPAFDTIVNSLDIIGSSLHRMQYAPDGKIYLSNMSRGKFYHVINSPDDLDIHFEQRGLALPDFSVRTLPNYPNYRLYDVPGSICDTLGINAPTTTTPQVQYLPFVKIWPNPAVDDLSIETTSSIERIEVLDALGSQMINMYPIFLDNKSKVDISQLPPGVYFISITLKGKYISRKVIKL